MGIISLVYSVISFLLELWVFILFIGQVYFEIIYKFLFPPEPKSLDDEIILITGAASGIGRQIALQIAAKARVKLVLWDVDKNGTLDLAGDLKRIGVEAFTYHVDLTQRSQIIEAAAKVRQDVGDVSMIINNAGVAYPQPFLESSRKPRNLELIFKTNVFAHQYIIGEFLSRMLELRKGHIVTVASALSFSSTAYLADYIASKHGIHGMIETLKDELARDPFQPDIKFTTAFPYFTNTTITGYNNATLVRRYPFSFPMLETSAVARYIVDGIRTNKEFVYCPGYLRGFLILSSLLPTKIVRAAKRLFTYELEMDRTYFETIASTPIPAPNDPIPSPPPTPAKNGLAKHKPLVPPRVPVQPGS
ncbi:17-beta-hydroxysteroid dehydrogenase 13, partial [Orchesella cincta]